MQLRLPEIFCDAKQAKHAIDIYNEEVTFFANKKNAMGALLSWYLIAEASIIVEKYKDSIDIANQALEIAQNPKINNFFFIVLLNLVLAKANISLSDYESAQMNLDKAVSVSKKYNMLDLLSKAYYIYARYYFELGSVSSQKQMDYLRGSVTMFDKATDIIVKTTKNTYLKDRIVLYKEKLIDFCNKNSIPI